MKTVWVIFALTFLFLTLPVECSLSEPVWVVGRVSSVVTEKRYNTIMYYEFSFSLAESNGTLSIGETIPVVIETTVMQPLQNAFYNFTGRVVDVQTDDIPRGFFVVEEVNVQTSVDWWSIIMQIVTVLSWVTKSFVEAIAAIFFVVTGWHIPAWIISLVVVGFSFYVLMKHWKAIGLLTVVIIAFVGVSGVLTCIIQLLDFFA